ncbi:MAG TPA: sugar phosphate nucleotidyltransferase [Terriglobia bacterium]|nr:sugar phosphate nucleotidyltransferase [Terriglobia bacterium]
MWGIVPAAGSGTRIQPLAFSKELLPVGSRLDGEVERPRAVSEYLLERMTRGGASQICFVIGPGKSDILEYFGGEFEGARLCYTVQKAAAGLCDAIFQALPFISRTEPVLIGLPDTIWFPENGFCSLPDDELSFLLFPVEKPEYFDAVVTGENRRVENIRVKQAAVVTKWVWGAIKMPGETLHELFALWSKRERRDEYIGTLVNEYLAQGGTAVGVEAGVSYADVGTLHGYREALRLLQGKAGSRK